MSSLLACSRQTLGCGVSLQHDTAPTNTVVDYAAHGAIHYILSPANYKPSCTQNQVSLCRLLPHTTFKAICSSQLLLSILSTLQCVVVEKLLYQVHVGHDHASAAVSCETKGIQCLPAENTATAYITTSCCCPCACRGLHPLHNPLAHTADNCFQ